MEKDTPPSPPKLQLTPISSRNVFEVAGLCPNCHRRAHYSHDVRKYNGRLAEIVRGLEN